MNEVEINAELVDILIMHVQIYMPTTNHKEEEVDNVYERENIG